MSLQKFSLEIVLKVRQHLQAQLTLPPSEQHPDQAIAEADLDTNPVVPTSLDALGDLFRVGSMGDDDTSAPNAEGRWFISTVDPAAAINKLPGLALKSGVRLVTYLQRQSGGGMGVTWALPELLSTTAELEAALENAGDSTIPPHPKGALGHVMDGLEGDRSAGSFIAASLLLRELKEFGRSGQNCRWSHHRLIAAVPPEQNWQWRTKTPADLSPKLQMREDGTALVEFFSHRTIKPISLFRHLDQYGAKSYRPKSNDQVIALL